MTNEVALPTEFKDIMREKILSTFMGMIPQDKIDEMMQREVDAFFNVNQLLTIKETIVSCPNLAYRPGEYGSKKTLDYQALIFGSHMTPFRQMVWSTLYENIKPKIQKVIDDENSKVAIELNQWLTETAAPKTTEVFKTTFTQTANTMSNMLFYKTMESAIKVSHTNMILSLQSVGVNTNTISAIPPISTAPII